MVDEMLSFKDLAVKAGLGESRARTLRDRYFDVIPSVLEGRRRRYPETAVSLLAKADKLEKTGKKGAAVLEELLGVSRYENDRCDLLDTVERLGAEIADLKNRISTLRRETSFLKRRIRCLEEKISRIETSGCNLLRIWKRTISFLDDFLDF